MDNKKPDLIIPSGMIEVIEEMDAETVKAFNIAALKYSAFQEVNNLETASAKMLFRLWKAETRSSRLSYAQTCEKKTVAISLRHAKASNDDAKLEELNARMKLLNNSTFSTYAEKYSILNDIALKIFTQSQK